MALPKNRIGHARGAKRAAQWKLSMPALSKCPRCHAYKLSHKVCPECGYYKNVDVLKLDSKKN